MGESWNYSYIIDCLLNLRFYVGRPGESTMRYVQISRVTILWLVVPVEIGFVWNEIYSEESAYNMGAPERTDECVSWGDFFISKRRPGLSAAGLPLVR